MNQQEELLYQRFKAAAEAVRNAAGTNELHDLLTIFGIAVTHLLNSIPAPDRCEKAAVWIRMLATTIDRSDDDAPTRH